MNQTNLIGVGKLEDRRYDDRRSVSKDLCDTRVKTMTDTLNRIEKLIEDNDKRMINVEKKVFNGFETKLLSVRDEVEGLKKYNDRQFDRLSEDIRSMKHSFTGAFISLIIVIVGALATFAFTNISERVNHEKEEILQEETRLNPGDSSGN